jgi:hypothetical protein
MNKTLGKIASLLAAAMFLTSLAGCATPQKDTVRVKCPACGYEFQVPASGGGAE